MRKMFSCLFELKEALLQTVFPPLCAGCGTSTCGYSPDWLCAACHGKIAFIGDGACTFCGSPPGEHAELAKGCAQCQPDRQSFTRAAGVAEFATPARELVHALKYNGMHSLAQPLGELMARRVASAGFPEKFDCVVPVPLHKKRLRSRGFNQSALLAAEIAKHLQSPLRLDILHRIRDTRSQALLSRNLRVTNPVGAFLASGAGGKVLLVDDVVTTGSTASECALALKNAGAARVYVISFAR